MLLHSKLLVCLFLLPKVAYLQWERITGCCVYWGSVRINSLAYLATMLGDPMSCLLSLPYCSNCFRGDEEHRSPVIQKKSKLVGFGPLLACFSLREAFGGSKAVVSAFWRPSSCPRQVSRVAACRESGLGCLGDSETRCSLNELVNQGQS